MIRYKGYGYYKGFDDYYYNSVSTRPFKRLRDCKKNIKEYVKYIEQYKEKINYNMERM